MRHERAIERRESAMEADMAGVPEFASHSGRDAQYDMLQKLIENSEREF